MATSQQTQEARQVSDAYLLALAYLGYTVIEDAWREWQTVDLSRPRTTSAAWADSVKALVQAARESARLLAQLYFRLHRALHTGATVSAPPGVESRDRETLGDLRSDFRQAVEDIIPPQRQKPKTAQGARMWKRAKLDQPIPNLPTGGFEDEVEVEKLDWPTDDSDDRADEAMEAYLDRLVVDINKALAEARKGDVADFEKWAAERREKVGTLQAGAAQLQARGSGRRELFLAGGRDARVIGYVRVSTTGDPCHFCAMLISRGMVLYGSKRTASLGEDGEEYHPGCNCEAEPIYSEAQFNSDDKFALNRELADLWKSTIKDRYSGNDAINEWRKVIRRRRASQPDTPPADAQAA